MLVHVYDFHVYIGAMYVETFLLVGVHNQSLTTGGDKWVDSLLR